MLHAAGSVTQQPQAGGRAQISYLNMTKSSVKVLRIAIKQRLTGDNVVKPEVMLRDNGWNNCICDLWAT